MLQKLQELLARNAPKEAEPGPISGKITLVDVLRRDWFELWYQPKIDLRKRCLAGAEALVRARRPDGSVISPSAFLPGAGEPEMLALTERVILTALRDFEDYAAYGAVLKLSVNVPASAFIKLPIAKLLREERPDATHWPGLILEVTEDEAMHDLKIAQEIADELRALNCSLALDDFGAGYSSLARLRELPFSELKIDRSHVNNCDTDKINAGFCEAIVELAKQFQAKTVAEGVETLGESQKLQSIGCDIGQGYLFAKPMPKDHFMELIARRMVRREPPVAKPRLTAASVLRGMLARS